MISGKGRIIYSNRDIYTGEFKNNKKDGKGEYLRENGEILIGTWKNDMKMGEFI
jgi:hypothetical protein